MSKIKVYDVDGWIRKEADMTCHTFKKVAIFQGGNGVVVAESEAVHDLLHSEKDSFRFHLTPIPEPGKIFLVSTAYVDVPVSVIRENAACEEMDFYEFFSRRNYNPRCESNFRYLCNQLKDIGYEIPREPLADKLRNADGRACAAQNQRSTPAQARC